MTIILDLKTAIGMPAVFPDNVTLPQLTKVVPSVGEIINIDSLLVGDTRAKVSQHLFDTGLSLTVLKVEHSFAPKAPFAHKVTLEMGLE